MIAIFEQTYIGSTHITNKVFQDKHKLHNQLFMQKAFLSKQLSLLRELHSDLSGLMPIYNLIFNKHVHTKNQLQLSLDKLAVFGSINKGIELNSKWDSFKSTRKVITAVIWYKYFYRKVNLTYTRGQNHKLI